MIMWHVLTAAIAFCAGIPIGGRLFRHTARWCSSCGRELVCPEQHNRSGAKVVSR